MSFRENSNQQITLMNSLWGLTERELKVLKNSWASIFSEDIFPNIDEKRFAVLYSDKASRPNTPVNIIVGALIIRELFDYSDDEMVENLMLDLHLQYALHTTNYKEQPLSDKTLSRFRKRCYEYEQEHGIDLLHDCVKDLSGNIQKLMKISGRIRRMDSMMIESNIKKLTRTELIYSCFSRFLQAIDKVDSAFIPDEMKHYTDPEDFNLKMYHQRCSKSDEYLKELFGDIDSLLPLCPEKYYHLPEYKLLKRCLLEQSVVEDNVRRLRQREDGGMNSHFLQNPTDPEATYRIKAGKVHVGYSANIEEAVDKSGSVITDYQYEENTHNDVLFLKERIKNQDRVDEKTTIITDGAYYSAENAMLAESKNMEIITTALSGNPTKDICADFEFSEDGKRVLRCPAGHEPRRCSCRSNGRCSATFDASFCQNCPLREQCTPKSRGKNSMVVTISINSKIRALCQRSMSEESYKDFLRLRNGVETIPSNLRNNFHVDKLPRGKQRGSFFFGLKIAALNFRKLFNYKKGTIKCAQNPVFA